MKKILVGIDFTEADQTLLDVVKPLAKAQGASITLIHSTPPMAQWVGCYLAFVHEVILERKEEAKRGRDCNRRRRNPARERGRAGVSEHVPQ